MAFAARLPLLFAALLVLAACGGEDATGDPTDSGRLPTAAIAVTDGDNRAELTVELAVTTAERGRGLMFREELPQDRGMLFVYQEDTSSGFWMKDTLIPLSIAFIAADGTIIDIQDMEPLSTDLHHSPAPYRYALEVNQGWFDDHGFGPGATVELPDALPTPVGQ